MARTFEPTYRDQLIRYAKRAGWVVLLLNIQGWIIALGIVTLPISIFVWTQARNLQKSAFYARELTNLEELPSADKVIAVLVTGYDYIGRFLWWYVFWYSLLLCGFVLSN